ncbi:hypothetical protein FIBSPDRAFT_127159 [Athelia psychrophila]|uniref:Uncharacterized protein n=1 Tax=Athelia psychrophila TaxID=1759441 RepID=A0A166T876_9AGAM|nr:hypothetical protein FIBSPDRAFT_127159 [Fibularhizoctonia sp. CBS 109695]
MKTKGGTKGKGKDDEKRLSMLCWQPARLLSCCSALSEPHSLRLTSFRVSLPPLDRRLLSPMKLSSCTRSTPNPSCPRLRSSTGATSCRRMRSGGARASSRRALRVEAAQNFASASSSAPSILVPPPQGEYYHKPLPPLMVERVEKVCKNCVVNGVPPPSAAPRYPPP